MKIWNGYGSEHSANLVMIGHFATADDAQRVVDKLDAVQAAVSADDKDQHEPEVFGAERFSDRMMETLKSTGFYSLRPAELEQFLLEIDWKPDANKVVVKTEETEVSALLKIFIDEGARVEVFSAHAHPGSGFGRGESE